MKRCEWAINNQLDQDYHDKEWGVPLHDEHLLFEFLTLEGAQAGLSWTTILKKREGYRKAFDDFDVKKVSRYSEKRIEKLLNNPDIVRNKLKVNSVVTNAKAFIAIQKEFGSFNKYIWAFVEGKPIKNKWKSLAEIPSNTDESDRMCKDLKKRGFRFVGTTICYAFMQATGMVNDHVTGCFRYKPISKLGK